MCHLSGLLVWRIKYGGGAWGYSPTDRSRWRRLSAAQAGVVYVNPELPMDAPSPSSGRYWPLRNSLSFLVINLLHLTFALLSRKADEIRSLLLRNFPGRARAFQLDLGTLSSISPVNESLHWECKRHLMCTVHRLPNFPWCS